MEKSKLTLTNKVKGWKEVFSAGNKEINADSSWKEILSALNLSIEDTLYLLNIAQKKHGLFTPQEKVFLFSLPYYKETLELLQDLPNSHFGDFFSSELPNGDTIYFLRHPKLDAPQVDVILVEVVIVTRQPVNFELETYAFIAALSCMKHISIRYAAKAPQEYLQRKAEYEKTVKQHKEKEERDDLPF